MSCKQSDVPVVPLEALELPGPGTGASSFPRARPRGTALEVRNGGDFAMEVFLEGEEEGWVRVRVGETRLALQVLDRRNGQVFLRTPSGRIIAPVVGPAGPLTEVSLGGPSLFVSPRSIAAPETLSLATASREVRAKLPGRVVRVFVAPGHTVRRGDPLLVLEAMKMEDEVRAPRDGRVASVLVREGQRAERDALLAVLEPDASA